MAFYEETTTVALFGPDPRSVQRTNYLSAIVTVVGIVATFAVALTRNPLEIIHVFFAVCVLMVAVPEFILPDSRHIKDLICFES
eukprot:gene6001-9127_t